ncbi:MAG: SUMF1/EgtB/PvdO family nonheme iron enzyme [Bdellovibrionaceae bacterium]|nr:SUMF1/EgtB/PvdO family nonheme iron enzyme [Pseudobdellovibrionaceae bacterium]
MLETNCSKALSSTHKNRNNRTEALKAYLGTLLEHQIIGSTELLIFIDDLERGELNNPIQKEKTWISIDALIHWEEIQNYLNHTELDKTSLLEFAKKSLAEKQRITEQREEASEETKDIAQKMEFFPIPSGNLKIVKKKKKAVVLPIQSFEAMSTPVMQKNWVEIMGENPSMFKKGEHSIAVDIHGRPITMQPENPAENITVWSAIVFLNRLSEKQGLKPTFDLSGIEWKSGTAAEDGSLDLESGEIKINAPNGDYYLSEGYRLPTLAEQEYMLQAAGSSECKYYFGNDEDELENHAWYRENSGKRTHPVAQLNPMIINGNGFYDTLGNVREWVWDGDEIHSKAEKKLFSKMKSTYHKIDGGAYFKEFPELFGTIYGQESGLRCLFIGFRPVRTLN